MGIAFKIAESATTIPTFCCTLNFQYPIRNFIAVLEFFALAFRYALLGVEL